MLIFTKFLSLLSGLLLFLNLAPASDASNITSLESDGELSSCNSLKHNILKLRLEIIEKFGHYDSEIDQKLKALEYQVEKLYLALIYQQKLTEPNASVEIGNEISTPAVAVPEEILNLVPPTDASNITSLNDDGEFSSVNILQYNIMKLRLEIIEKFGHYDSEIDQKLKALEYQVEKLYLALKYHQKPIKYQTSNVSLEIVKEISTPAVVVAATKSVPGEIASSGKMENVAAITTDRLYITGFVETEEAEVCKTVTNGTSVCSKLQLPTSCASPKGLTCSNNKCRIQVVGLPSFIVSCDEDWIVIQRRINGSVDFNRDWSAYKKGFGDLDGEFWMGLDKIHALTKALAPVELFIQMKAFNGTESYAKYDAFAIGSEAEKYIITSLGTYSGNAGQSLGTNAGKKFTTYDRDNDKNDTVNCAQLLSGGWWFYMCDPGHNTSNLNGKYYEGESASNVPRKNGIKWKTFLGVDKSLKFVQMAIKKK